MIVEFTPAARRDVIQQIVFLLDEGAADAAARFPRAVEHALATLSTFPELGVVPQWIDPGLTSIRSWPIPGFEIIRIYYRIPDDNKRLLVVRVLHGRRDLPRDFAVE